MSDRIEEGARPADGIGRALFRLSEILALFGGLVVCVMAVTILANIVGRAAFSSSISGIVDLIELGTSTAVFAFLPYCQITRSNVIVDFIMSGSPTRAKTACDALGSLIYLILAVILTWRLTYGGIDMYQYNESFMTIGMPRWFSFPYVIVCMAVLVAVIAYTLGRSIAETRANRYF